MRSISAPVILARCIGIMIDRQVHKIQCVLLPEKICEAYGQWLRTNSLYLMYELLFLQSRFQEGQNPVL